MNGRRTAAARVIARDHFAGLSDGLFEKVWNDGRAGWEILAARVIRAIDAAEASELGTTREALRALVEALECSPVWPDWQHAPEVVEAKATLDGSTGGRQS